MKLGKPLHKAWIDENHHEGNHRLREISSSKWTHETKQDKTKWIPGAMH